MTLEEFKIKVLSMIEEYNENAENLTDDDESADFAKDELDYIKKQKGESNNEKR